MPNLQVSKTSMTGSVFAFWSWKLWPIQEENWVKEFRCDRKTWFTSFISSLKKCNTRSIQQEHFCVSKSFLQTLVLLPTQLSLQLELYAWSAWARQPCLLWNWFLARDFYLTVTVLEKGRTLGCEGERALDLDSEIHRSGQRNPIKLNMLWQQTIILMQG